MKILLILLGVVIIPLIFVSLIATCLLASICSPFVIIYYLCSSLIFKIIELTDYFEKKINNLIGK